MAHFLLVHGSCHGAWCWDAVIAALGDLGHAATAIDLPGSGDDPAPRAGVTLRACAEAVLEALEGPTILVGHSAGGYAIAAAAERAADRPAARAKPAGTIAALVYLCAYRPQSGLSLVQMRRAAARQPLRGTFRLADGCYTFDPAMLEDRFYHDCPPGTAARAAARLTPQPLLPQETPLVLTAASAAIPAHYILCTEDRAIPPEHQQAMAADLPPGRVLRLPSGHSPFFSMPGRLASLLAAIAGI